MDGSGSADQVERAAQSPGDSTAGASHTREVDPLTVTQRLQREGRWKDIEPERNEMMKLARKKFKTKEDRQHWVYSELDRLYPPIELENAEVVDKCERTLPYSNRSGVGGDSGSIQGLGDIPDGWPELPANSSLATEVGWVQANRLRVIEERSGAATLIHLDRALSPAPSRATLGWLETSVRSYSKYVDVAARATSTDDGEAAVMRRERMALEDVCGLLEEMRADG